MLMNYYGSIMSTNAHVCYICKIMLQLSELVNVEGYSDWIRLVAEFTLKSLQSWQVGWCLLLSIDSVRMLSIIDS